MPFTAHLGDELVCPYQVPLDGTVTCPSCGGSMWVRKEYRREGKLIPRVFVHQDVGDCQGESNDHVKLKALSVHSLEQWIPEANISIEQKIEGTNRIADVVAEFPIDVVPYGKGIIVEAQVSNHSKNIGKVTREYLNAGWSVYWSYLSDISGSTIEIEDNRLYPLWPEGVPYKEPEERYHDLYAARHMRGRNAPTYKREPMEIVLPPEFYEVHGHDIKSPRDAPGWNNIETVWLKPDGEKIVWTNVLHPGGYELVIEVWKKDRSADTVDYVSNLRIAGADDIERLDEFANEAAQAIPESPQGTIQKELTKADGVTTGFSLSHEDEEWWLTVSRAGHGFRRSLSIGASEDMIKRLRTLPQALREGINKIASPA